MTKQLSNNQLFSQIVDLLQSARSNVVRTVNKTMVITYFEIGRLIVEEEQNGDDRAKYGKNLLRDLSRVLNSEFGKGFSVKNLERMRFFYLTYGKSSTLLSKSDNSIKSEDVKDFKLSWSHYLKLMRIDNINERKFYEIEATKKY